MNTKLNFLAAAVTGLALQFCPQAHSITVTSIPGVTIPDNDLNGVANTVNLSTSINFITDVSVTLDIMGGYNGDFYAYFDLLLSVCVGDWIRFGPCPDNPNHNNEFR